MPKNAEFICENCQFKTSKKSNFDIHLLTLKHLNVTNVTIDVTEKMPNVNECDCGKKYKSRVGLWRHKKTCTVVLLENKPIEFECKSEISILSDIVYELKSTIEKSESEILLHKEIKELKTIVEELKSNGISSNQTINHNHNNNNNNNTQNNNQFNLQMYLDETCSNAMNIDTFLKNINVTIENVIEIGEIGYSKGIGNLIAKHINAMKQTDKPIQTTDVKRGLSWIKNKDNEWVKDEDLALGNNLILFVGDKYFRKYNVGYKTIDEWRDGQSRIHAKIIKSLHQIATTVSTDDRSGYYSKIHKIIAENTVIKK